MFKPIRVLHVLGALNRGGAETMVMNLYRNIDREKVQFDFIIHTNKKCDYDDEIKSLGGKIYNLPRYKGINHYQYKKAWREFLKKHPEYKIVHGHMRSTASIYLKIANRYGCNTIAHSHNTSSGKGITAVTKNIYQYQIRYIADYLFACSQTAGTWLFGKNVLDNEKFLLLKNAIDTKKFTFNKDKRKTWRKELNIEDKFVIGHIGRFHAQKNHDLLINIFKEVHDKNKDAVLLLVGEGHLRNSIEKKVDELGLNNNVIFTGVRTDIPELLQAMDVFVFPSLYEGLGIVVIEAQTAGLQSIVADTLPAEVYLTDLIQTVPLSAPIDTWAQKIIQYSGGYNRDSNSHQIINSKGYDIEQNALWLENFYLNMEN
ncbi:glycosyltransferase family 1 protein [Bacillus sp. CHD6a]|uniref:glycosyltransferase family 1 protein n=1 Tax=Bacillus sp. CHD6a TaxID=1643452 RepID=UPI0006CD7703|nr:glycosyltransferase family 1 protein [Bacillus sp. CHD6a]KPB05741.1 glycosyl transferase family 1 [Bacillus sp. CHD6a]